MLFDSGGGLGGLGASPFGTFFGAGSGGDWGLFPSTLKVAYLQVSCEACGRVRSQSRLGGAAVFGVFIEGNVVGIAVSDVVRPTSCYSLRVEGPDGTYERTLSFSASLPPAILAPAPPVVAPTPPAGAPTVNTVLTCTLPEIQQAGLYTLTLVDTCCGCESPLVQVFLEGAPMFLLPRDADLGGAPAQWLRGSRLLPGAVQPAQSTRQSIPFDKCTSVVEYDSRAGDMPDLSGWVRVGTGPATEWTLVPGGAFRLSTAGANTNYYERTLPLATAPSQIYAYSSLLPESIGVGGIGDGFELQALYGAAASPYDGVRVDVREIVYPTRLDGSFEGGSTLPVPSEWISICGGDAAGSTEALYEQSAVELGYVDTAIYGPSLVVAGATSLYARFGNVTGGVPVAANVRTVVVADGRFIRPLFSTFTQVSTPTLRLYLAAESGSSITKTARFKVTYGPGAGGAYAPLTQVAQATINMTIANSIYETAFSLPGLAANQPFWFSVERDWTHPEDILDSTVHLFHATVRSL
jgi:hypothetical protein